jgi:hypothetical protein
VNAGGGTGRTPAFPATSNGVSPARLFPSFEVADFSRIGFVSTATQTKQLSKVAKKRKIEKLRRRIHALRKLKIPLMPAEVLDKLRDAGLPIHRQTLANWKTKCPLLEGKPFAPDHDDEGRECYKPERVADILSVFLAAMVGQYKSPKWGWLLSEEKVRELLLPVWHREKNKRKVDLHNGTLLGWHRKGCIHLPDGRTLNAHLLYLGWPPGGASFWYEEKDIYLIRDALTRYQQGRADDGILPDGKADPLYTACQAAKYADVSKYTIYAWEEDGLITPEPVEGAGPHCLKATKLYRESALDEAKERDKKYPKYFEDRKRISLTAAAPMLMIGRGRLERLVKRLLDPERREQEPDTRELYELLEPKKITIHPSLRGCPTTITLLTEGVKKLRERRLQRLREKPPKEWQVHDGVLKHFGVRDWGRGNIALIALRPYFQLAGRYAKVHLSIPDKKKRRKRNHVLMTWHYNVPEIVRLLAGHDFLDLADPEKAQAILPAHQPEAPAKPDNKKTTAVRDTGTPKRQKKRGPKEKKETLDLYEFCYGEYRLKGKKRFTVFSEARKRFGRPKQKSHVTRFAGLYAKNVFPVKPEGAELAALLELYERGELRAERERLLDQTLSAI